MPRARWASIVAVASMLGLAAHFALTGATLGPGDRYMFGLEAFDARLAYVAVAVVGAGTTVWAKLRPWWLVLQTPLTLGRAATLVFAGSPDLGRGAEIRGASGWTLLWALGILSVLVLEAADVFRPRGR